MSEHLRVVSGQGGLAARGVGKVYKKRPVVRNVTISVRRGAAFATSCQSSCASI